jgi:hypothetical protein
MHGLDEPPWIQSAIEWKDGKMDGSARNDIRRLLKEFGVRADEAVVSHLAINSEVKTLHIRLELTDLTDYGDSTLSSRLGLQVEGTLNRNSA